MGDQNIPIARDWGVSDVRELPRAPWKRHGGNASLINLRGLESFTGLYVADVPPGVETKPQKYLYEDVIYVLEGSGTVEIWAPGASDGEHVQFSVQPNTMFAIPLNCWYQLRNSGSDPMIYVGSTTAPIMFDLIYDTDYIYNCDHRFAGRFEPTVDYADSERGVSNDVGTQTVEGNVFKDVLATEIKDDLHHKGGESVLNSFEMVGNVLTGHITAWPPENYQHAHYHQGGATLLIVRGEGYSLMWPNVAGNHPYEDGNADQVVKVDWRVGSVFSPPTNWFHQHFNTGKIDARQVAFRYGSRQHPVGFRRSAHAEADHNAVMKSYKEGGTLILREDEDPQIALDFAEAIRGK